MEGVSIPNIRLVSSRQHRAVEVRKLRFCSSCQYTHGCCAPGSWAARLDWRRNQINQCQCYHYLIFKVRDDYTVYNKLLLNKHLLFCKVVVPTKGPCATNNGGCDQICTDESGTVQCYCEAGYFSIAFLPTKCFGKPLKSPIATNFSSLNLAGSAKLISNPKQPSCKK